MLREIYPPCPVLEPTCSINNSPLPCSSTFLDISCTLSTEGQLSFRSVFKTETLPFQPIQYIKLRSNRPVLMCFNTLKGLSYSAASRCSSPESLILDLKSILKIFHKNGFPHKKCVSTILSFLSSANVPAASFDLQWFVATFQKRLLPRV